MSEIKNIGIFTSGGDAPGMNACIRAAVRTAHQCKIEVTGIYEGYDGLINAKFNKLSPIDVSGIIHTGGTILKSSRSEAFMTPEGRKKAYENMKAQGIDALIAIGGDGTFKGAEVFNQEFDVPIVGCPGTIDNNLFGTDYTIGFDTACNTAVEAIDKIRDTATSHNRMFLVEVMGKDAGYIALHACVAGGGEAVLLPEQLDDLPRLMRFLKEKSTGKIFANIIVVAEGDETGGATEVEKLINMGYPEYETKVTVLGHLQRGGSPTCKDRLLSGKLGMFAVDALLQGKFNVMVGEVHQKVKFTPFHEAGNKEKPLDPDLVRMSETLVI